MEEATSNPSTPKPKYSRLAESAMALSLLSGLSVIAVPVLAKLVLNDVRATSVIVWTFLAMLGAPLSVLLGIAALVRLRKRPELVGRGKAWFGMVLGSLVSAFFAYTILS